VVALTQWALIGLAEALGSVDTDQGPVQSHRLLSVLEDGTDEDGRAFMNSVFEGLIAQISGPSINGSLFQLVRATSLSFNEKQTLVYMFDDDMQAIVSRAGWSGAIPDVPGDRIIPVDSNVGWSKVDRNIERSLVYEVALNQVEPSIAKVTVGYKNLSLPGSSECGTQSLKPGASYGDLKNTCYWNLLRLYTAEGGAFISADPLPLPATSVYAGLGLGASGDDTVALGIGPGGSFVSGLLVVPPGDERTTSFTMQLPPSVLKWDHNRATYTLNLAVQPGTRGRETTVRVELPSGYEFVSGSIRPTSIIDSTIRFDFTLIEDTVLSVQMQQIPVPNTALPEPRDVVGAS
jgi:hypothetical protein